MRCPVVIGRDIEVDSLLGLIDAAKRGSGEATVLVGEAGIGKSRLARHALEVARRAGLTTLVGRADQLSADTPMVPVAEALIVATRRLTAPTEERRLTSAIGHRLSPCRRCQDRGSTLRPIDRRFSTSWPAGARRVSWRHRR